MTSRTALPFVAQMAEADRLTVAAGTSVNTLMERAGKAVAWCEIAERWPVSAGGLFASLCSVRATVSQVRPATTPHSGVATSNL